MSRRSILCRFVCSFVCLLLCCTAWQRSLVRLLSLMINPKQSSKFTENIMRIHLVSETQITKHMRTCLPFPIPSVMHPLSSIVKSPCLSQVSCLPTRASDDVLAHNIEQLWTIIACDVTKLLYHIGISGVRMEGVGGIDGIATCVGMHGGCLGARSNTPPPARPRHSPL